jgi:transposase
MTTPTPSRSSKAKRRKHTKEFKQEAVLLARRSDVGFARAAKDLGIHESLLRSWAKAQATEGADAFRGHGRKAALEAENARLVRENRTLMMERDILKKATAFFARESP